MDCLEEITKEDGLDLCKPIQFGNSVFPNRVFYAPLAGCSDFPFRQMSAKYRPGLMYCEMIKMDALIRNDHHTFHLLDYDVSMHPIGAQLCGSKPEMAGPCAKMVEAMGFDVIDFNCGCPVDKVTKDGSGSAMLKTPNLIGEIIEEMVSAVKIPVTVKIRAGWDETHINAPEITKIAEQAGAKAICIHGRTREQGYKGAANWDWIRDCKQVAKTIYVIGNGDVVGAESAQKIVQHTGCDAVLVSRGTMGQPWIVEEILRFFKNEPFSSKTLEDARRELLEHYQKVLHYSPGKKAVVDARRIGCWYLKNSPGTRTFREKISRVESDEEALELIKDFIFDV